MQEKINTYVNNTHWKDDNSLQVYYSNLLDFRSCTPTIFSHIAIVIPYLNVPQRTLSYLSHS